MSLRPIIDGLWRLALRIAYRLILAYWFVTRPCSHGVYVLAWWNGRALLVRHSYKRGLFFPGGGLNRGEDYRTAAARELGEEVGIIVEADRLERIGQLVNRHEFKYDMVEVFEVTLEREPTVEIDNREIISAHWVTIDEARRLDLSPMVSEFLLGLRGSVRPSSA